MVGINKNFNPRLNLKKPEVKPEVKPEAKTESTQVNTTYTPNPSSLGNKDLNEKPGDNKGNVQNAVDQTGQNRINAQMEIKPTENDNGTLLTAMEWQSKAIKYDATNMPK